MRHTRGMTDTAALARLAALELETPSWGYGNSGTRFHVFPWPGAARSVHERIADAALVHRLTGACPSVAIHIPWDRVDDWDELVRFAQAGPDFQYIANPGYNRDRGPAFVFGGRLRVAY